MSHLQEIKGRDDNGMSASPCPGVPATVSARESSLVTMSDSATVSGHRNNSLAEKQAIRTKSQLAISPRTLGRLYFIFARANGEKPTDMVLVAKLREVLKKDRHVHQMLGLIPSDMRFTVDDGSTGIRSSQQQAFRFTMTGSEMRARLGSDKQRKVSAFKINASSVSGPLSPPRNQQTLSSMVKRAICRQLHRFSGAVEWWPQIPQSLSLIVPQKGPSESEPQSKLDSASEAKLASIVEQLEQFHQAKSAVADGEPDPRIDFSDFVAALAGFIENANETRTFFNANTSQEPLNHVPEETLQRKSSTVVGRLARDGLLGINLTASEVQFVAPLAPPKTVMMERVRASRNLHGEQKGHGEMRDTTANVHGGETPLLKDAGSMWPASKRSSLKTRYLAQLAEMAQLNKLLEKRYIDAFEKGSLNFQDPDPALLARGHIKGLSVNREPLNGKRLVSPNENRLIKDHTRVFNKSFSSVNLGTASHREPDLYKSSNTPDGDSVSTLPRSLQNDLRLNSEIQAEPPRTPKTVSFSVPFSFESDAENRLYSRDANFSDRWGNENEVTLGSDTVFSKGQTYDSSFAPKQ